MQKKNQKQVRKNLKLFFAILHFICANSSCAQVEEYYQHRRRTLLLQSPEGGVRRSVDRALKGLLGLGIMKLSLAVALPFALLAAR